MRPTAVRRIAWAALVAALAVLVGLPALWLATRPATSEGSLAAVEAALDAPTGTTGPGGSHVPSGPAAVPGTVAPPVPAAPASPPPATAAPARPVAVLRAAPERVPTHDARLSALRAERRAAPRWIRIARIGVSAEVRPYGIAPDGAMELPYDSRTVAWYRFGPAPGEPGSAVLAAHVDWTDGPGPFYRLRDLRPGDEVSVALGDGSGQRYRVAALRVYRKEALPDLVWRRRGKPVLTLITCGGTYDAARRHYEENVVVYALPA